MTTQARSRVLVVGINYAPENIGTGKYTSEMCSWLAGRGHAVRMITAPPYYPAWQIWHGHSGVWFRRQEIDGVEVIRCPLWVPAKPSGLKRLLHLGSFGVSSALALVASLGWRPTHVVAIAPTLVSAPAAWLVSRLVGARCQIHIQDFELDAALDMGIVQAGRFRLIAGACERWLLRRFDRVSTISPKMVERLGTKGVDVSKQMLLPNWADIDSIKPLDQPSPYRRELDIPDDAVVALYSGNMGLKQGLELLGEAALRLRDRPDIYFVFGGQGPGRDGLEAQCGHLPNVRFLGLQPKERLNEWLGLADIHLLPQRADVADLVMPSKLTGMLASGRPTLATALPDTGVALALNSCGRVVHPGDTAGFVDALRSLADDAGERCALGQIARQQAIATLARDDIMQRFEHSFTSVN
ncbi:glycosyltransferase WbuB [Pseudoxanthomonas suwonensis]|uniref:glycosyltransferase WbuB n=1 Tax=Pseudoxanthomonas suwonensis TaxID=314722 RepID=UPI0009DEEF2B|nr:glycosyltransferase WbuB [Pseudoxanthomonas suwonensis]